MEDIMPVFKDVKTKGEGKLVWTSPDGQRKIYEVALEVDGKEMSASTFSDKIIVDGWSGNIESYEKSGRTFVKQYRDEQSGGGYRGGSKPMADPFTMYLSYAKDLVVAKIASTPDLKVPPIAELVQDTIKSAYTLFEARPDAPKEAETQELTLDA